MNEWYCPECNMKNPGSLKTCSSCGYKKAADVVEVAGGKSDTNSKWKCNICNYENPPKTNKCLECGAAKYSQKEKKKITPALIVIPSAIILLVVIPFIKGVYGSSEPTAEISDTTAETTTYAIESKVTTAKTVPELSANETLEELHLSSMYPNIYYQLYKKLKTTSLSKDDVVEMIMPYSDRYIIEESLGAYIITDELEPNNKIELYFKYLEEYDIEVLSSMNYHYIGDLYVMYVQNESTGLTYSVINSVAGKFTYNNYEDCERKMLNRSFDEIPHDVVE